MIQLGPGPDQPYPPQDAAALGELFGVDAAAVRRWIDAGLTPLADGRIDPMTACNWLSWGRLERSPALARRWRRWQACFEPHRLGLTERVEYRWRRHHALYLPRPVTCLRWWLPDPVDRGVQVCGRAVPLAGSALAVEPEAGGTSLRAEAASAVLEVAGEARVRVATWRVELPPSLRVELRDVTEAVVGAFRYEYRRHSHGDGQVDAPWTGTCLDCALVLKRTLEERGHACALEGGVVARDEIANPHYWVVVSDPQWGVIPIDPSIPAIVRMLGGEWRDWIPAYLGAIDARRITLSSGTRSWPGGDERFLDPVPGEAWCDQGGLWECQDWVCGRTRAGFDVKHV